MVLLFCPNYHSCLFDVIEIIKPLEWQHRNERTICYNIPKSLGYENYLPVITFNWMSETGMVSTLDFSLGGLDMTSIKGVKEQEVKDG